MALNQIAFVDQSALVVDAGGLAYITPEAPAYGIAIPGVDMRIKRTATGCIVQAGINQWYVPTAAQVSGIDFTQFFPVDSFV